MHERSAAGAREIADAASDLLGDMWKVSPTPRSRASWLRLRDQVVAHQVVTDESDAGLHKAGADG